ncbi:LysR family transcriptional regulator [Lampropedia puyangensis]|uniref:LysR family transcriptional regulator n=1 Tax=Lampropedia puyangensis TaxID=1330072 RepID=A0A4S8ET64_9BURK|nr:LysR substrate-binding domain-containing protein [Lampropedia puyangensis]THT98089.1 LysR family transcriptional regulator [Lampropedia puyangensis]
MNFQQLRSVRETIRCNFNLTEVANTLYTSQPGVSRHIRELEEELGVEIFERHGKRLIGLTDIGHQVARYVERTLREAQNITTASNNYTARDSGTLTIATTHTQARYALPKVVLEFRKRFPNVTLALQQGSPRQIVEALREGRADIGFASEALHRQTDFVHFSAYTWLHRVITPLGHPLTQLEHPTLADLAQYPIITYEQGFTGRHRVDEAFYKEGLTPQVIMTAIDADTIKTYVQLGIGIGLVAEHAYDPIKDDGLHCFTQTQLIAPNTATLAVREGVYLRDYGVAFIKAVAPQISTQEILERIGRS